MAILEICCGNIESVHAAVKGGARRVELCSALELDGLTPSWDSLRKARALYPSIKIHVLIRPRSGGFCYTASELSGIKADILTALQLGADGIVAGCLTPEGDVDIPAMRELMTVARNVTFHRAFDVCRDPHRALEEIVGLGCARLLTSGQARTAEEGVGLIQSLQEQAGGRIIIMPGCGVTPLNARHILESTGCTEIHASASVTDGGRKVTSARTVREIAAALRQTTPIRATDGKTAQNPSA